LTATSDRRIIVAMSRLGSLLRPATLLLSVVAAAFIVGCVFGSDDGDKGSDRQSGGYERTGAWWEDLLTFVPNEAPYSGSQIYLANFAQVRPKFGFDSTPCPEGGLDGWVESLTDEESELAIEMMDRVGTRDAIFNRFPSKLTETIGFDACDLTSSMVMYGDLAHEISAFRVHSSISDIDDVLHRGGYSSSARGSTTLYSKGGDLEATSVPYISALNRIAVDGDLVVRARATATIDAVVNARAGGNSFLSHIAVGRLVAALGRVDAILILSPATAPAADGTVRAVAEDELGALPPADPDPSWDSLPRFARMAAGYLRTESGDDVMKIAVDYRTVEAARDAQIELTRRLSGFRLRGADLLCDSSNVTLEEHADGAFLMIECVGGRTESWYSILRDGSASFLTAEPEPPAPETSRP
jgi:hypothetical protein